MDAVVAEITEDIIMPEPERKSKQTKLMRLKLRYLVWLFCMFGSPSWSLTAELIQPQSVYQAAYCAEYLRHNANFAVGGVDDQIKLGASVVIGGGDNIEFAQLGIEDAQRKVLAFGNVGRHAQDDIKANLKECAQALSEEVERSKWYSCGYGRGSSSDEEVKKYLSFLELPLPERSQHLLISIPD